jgi:hypothetical protein
LSNDLSAHLCPLWGTKQSLLIVLDIFS